MHLKEQNSLHIAINHDQNNENLILGFHQESNHFVQ